MSDRGVLERVTIKLTGASEKQQQCVQIKLYQSLWLRLRAVRSAHPMGMEACFHHGIKNKQVILSLYLTIQAFFL